MHKLIMYKNIKSLSDNNLLKEYKILHILGVSSYEKNKFKYFVKLSEEIQRRKLDTGEVYFT